MKKLLAVLMVAMMVMTFAPFAMAAEGGTEETAPVEEVTLPEDEGAADEAPVVEDEAPAADEEVPAPAEDDEAPAEEAPADEAEGAAEEAPAEEEESSSFYNSRNLIIGGVSLAVMVAAFIILRVKMRH